MVQGEKTITFALKDCFSCFGLSYNKKFKNYSIGINVDNKLFSKLKAVEAKAETFLDRKLKKPLLRCLVEKGEYKTLYLKPKPDQFDQGVLDERSVIVSGLITITAIYLGCEHPSLLVRVDDIDIKKAPSRENIKLKFYLTTTILVQVGERIYLHQSLFEEKK